jgi:two-component system, OmpR family, sensor kinase
VNRATERKLRPSSPLTLRIRLAIVFAVSAALFGAAIGTAVLAIHARNSDGILTKALRQRIDTIASNLTEAKGHLPDNEIYAQVFADNGNVIDLSPSIGIDEYLLTQEQLRFVARVGSLQVERNIPQLGGRARLLAEKRYVRARTIVVVVGSSFEVEEQGRRRLLLTFALIGPILVGLLGFGGWLIAGAALRPVLRMTDEAAAISASNLQKRLELPRGQTEIAHLGATLNAMLDRLEAGFERERAFVDDASHELRTPLAILRGELELAMLHPQDSKEIQQTLGASLEEVDRLSRLAEDLLVLARAAQAPSERPQPLNILDATNATIHRLGASFPTNISVAVTGDPVEAPIRLVDWQRVVTNLVSNAIRYATTKVGIDVVQSDNHVYIRVFDDGHGFADDLLPRAFERFTVGSASRTRDSHGQTGIGLAIVRAIVESNGGTVTAANLATGGAEVTVVLPQSNI